MAKSKIFTTDDDLERIVTRWASPVVEPRVTNVHLSHLAKETELVMDLDDGSHHVISKSKIEGLADAPDEVVSRFEINPDGLGLRWPDLDLDLYLPALLQGIYGTQKWMASLGRAGGKVRSDAKAKAARENGKRGGRPRKVLPVLRKSRLDAKKSNHSILSADRRSTRRESAFQYDCLQRTKGEYAVLFGFNEQTLARSLPRIA